MHTILLPFLIFALVSISLVVGVANSDSHSLALRKRTVPLDDYPLHQPSAFISSGEQDEALQLLDIVLLASVDGKFHALNRTSGHTLWSMAASSTAETPSTLGPLVRTTHPAQMPSSSSTDEDELDQEVYIIEPQSGDIYVMTSPNSPLQRLAFSMSELVNMSPFDFSLSEHGDKRVFVGRKETSMFTLELETGVVKEVNAECPWDPFEDLKDGWEDDVGIDLDELENPVVKDSTEISIGRTDYHITIYTRSPPASRSSKTRSKTPVQNLSFSTYGPNNRDASRQASYSRPVDDAYVQSFPNGDIFSFRTSENNTGKHTKGKKGGSGPPIDALWHAKSPMHQPIVAVFDIVRTTASQAPFALLQPRPILSNPPTSSSSLGAGAGGYDALPGRSSAYVGLLEESDALFAMSAGRYPLVAFDHPFTDHIADVVDRTCKNAGKEAAWGVTDKRCMVGTKTLAQVEAKHSMEGSKGIGLLDGAPLPLPILPAESSSHNPGHHRQPHRTIGNDEVDNTTIITPNTWPWAALHTSSALLPYIPYIGGGNGHSAFATAVLWATGLGLIGAMWMYKRFKGVRVRFNFEFPEADVAKEVTLQLDVANPLPVVPLNAAEQESPLENATIATAPIAVPTPESPPTVTDPIAAVSNTPEIVSSLDADGDESGGEGGDGENGEPEKRKGRKKRRGKKKKAGVADPGEGEEKEAGKDEADKEDKEDIKVQEEEVPTGLVFSHAPKPVQVQAQAPTSLIVSDTILGFGSHGTVVFSGSLQGRAVAVKRLLQDFVTLAAREVSILQESDDHPNVIRYYYQEAQANFLYIALELCPCSLADIIEAPQLHQEISAAFDPKRALRQITSGLRHLHGLKLIHRDIKPQNILVSSAKRNGTGKDRGHRMLISDFGLCKKLDFDQTSFLPTAHGAAGAGTVGWRAPEILRGEVKLDDALNEDTVSSRGSVTGKNTSLGGTSTGSTIGDKPTRLTKLVDIFALGCLFYYTLTNGGHPYGDRFEREVNILKNQKSLEGLERFGEEGAEAAELISSMLSIEARERPDTTTCLLHPFFWDQGRRLTFLQDASDRFEIMCRDPRDPLLVTLEKGAYDIVGNDWHTRLDKIFIDNLGKFRKYDGRSVQDLLRALRNKKHHYQDLPDNVKRHLGPMPEGFLSYFTKRYPCLFLHVHGVVSSTSLRYESMFRSYFDLAD